MESNGGWRSINQKKKLSILHGNIIMLTVDVYTLKDMVDYYTVDKNRTI